MRTFLIISCVCVALACSKVNSAPAASPTPEPGNSLVTAPTPPIGQGKYLKPVVPELKLNKDQKKNLDEILPPKVREILEKSGSFDVLAEKDVDKSDLDGMEFNPNRIARITSEAIKKELLEGLYFDVSTEPYPAVCYEPHHGIRAEYEGQKIEIDICFSCSRLVVRSPFGEFSGGMTHGQRKLEAIFERIVGENAVELKK